ncbi:MAG: WYL domain-containing protein, partial [Planctomycetia bacterium]
MPPNDSQRLTRLLRLIHTLSQGVDGVSVQDIATREGLDEKTIRRDLVLLKNMGLPLEERRAKFGRKLWLIRPEVENGQFNIFEGLHSATETKKKERPSRSESIPTELEQMLYFSTTGTRDFSRRAHLISTILQSITQRQALQLTYRKPSESASLQYTIHPYSLAAWHGSLYVVARSVAAGAMRHFELDRIEGIEMLLEKYRIPRDFNVETYFQS